MYSAASAFSTRRATVCVEYSCHRTRKWSLWRSRFRERPLTWWMSLTIDTIDSADLIQRVVGPMHRDGHTLDVVITPRDMTVPVTIDPPVMSDHSLITAAISSGPVLHCFSNHHHETVDKFRCRCFRDGPRKLKVNIVSTNQL